MRFLNMKSLKHLRHDWEIVYASKWGTVTYCEGCHSFQTIMMDLSKGETITISGNLLAVRFANFFILCGTEEEYREACVQLEEKMGIKEDQCRRLYKPEQVDGWVIPPIIYLWGTWWENEVVQTETVRRALNGWL